MELTREKIIQILFTDSELKTKLLKEWDSFNPDLKFELEQLLWDGYYAIYQIRLQENLQLMLKQAKEKKIPLDRNFYNQVQEQTEKDLETETANITDSNELSLVRQKIENLLT
jgi:hypothetical protein